MAAVVNNLEEGLSPQHDTVDSKREKIFYRRLNAFFDAHGMSKLTKNMALAYVQMMASDEDHNFDRVQPWLLSQINDVRVFPAGCSEWQKKCPSLIPGLRSTPFWDTTQEDMAWVNILQDKYEVIREELLTLNGQKKFQPYRAPTSNKAKQAEDGIGSVSHDSGSWNVMYLYLHNMDFSENQACCPVTCEAIKAIDSQYSHAMFSSMAPQTHITKHNGPTNKKLRCHLPLIVPKNGGCRLRVGDEVRDLQEGKCIVFDDSYEHESWNDDPEAARICLIMDMWHPDLTKKEVKFLNFLQNAALKAEKSMIKQRDEEQRLKQEEGKNENAQSEEVSTTATTKAELGISAEEQSTRTRSVVQPSVQTKEFDNFFTVIDAAQSLCADDSGVFKQAN